MKKSALIVLILLLSALLFSAAAEQVSYCDPVPQELNALLDETPQDCIVFHAPDGTTHACIISEYGYMLGDYRLVDGNWESIAEGLDIPNSGNISARFVRHRADQLRPDGTPYGDDQGFDVSCDGGIYDSYHWNGEYYSLCGWHNPDWYSGTVMIRGTVLQYYPAGSTVPEYEADAKDELTLLGWTNCYQERPGVPAEVTKREALMEDTIRDDFPGMELVEYIAFNSDTQADTMFAEVKYSEEAKGYVFSTVRAHYDTAWEGAESVFLADIPVSEQMKDVPVRQLWENNHELLMQPGTLDTGRLPVKGRVVQLDPYQDYLVLLTENEAGQRRVAVAYQAPGGTYTVEETKVLPADSGLDLFHAGQDEIYVECNQQAWMAGFDRTDSGWQLAWVFGDGVDYSVQWGIISCSGNIPDQDSRIVGSLDNIDLMTTDFTSIPLTLDALKQAINREDWAVVNNPNPEDRLYLRSKAGERDTSLGKFYNGTPVRVLETKKDWCRVKIGANGPEGWMMKKFLAFGEQMNSVETAFPALDLLEEYWEKGEGWADPEKKHSAGPLKNHTWHIMGVLDDLYILFDDAGSCVYAPMNWFWAGNG